MYLKKHERHFLCPKGGRHTSLPALSETRLAFLVGDLQTPERKALAEICCLSHVFIIDDQALLLMEVSDETLETLAAFAVAEEDMENDLCDEPDEGEEDDSASDEEYSLGGLENMNQAGWAVGGLEDRELDTSDLEESSVE